MQTREDVPGHVYLGTLYCCATVSQFEAIDPDCREHQGMRRALIARHAVTHHRNRVGTCLAVEAKRGASSVLPSALKPALGLISDPITKVCTE